ncbi:hypothetical protein [Lysinibacillus xylanilyticus]
MRKRSDSNNKAPSRNGNQPLRYDNEQDLIGIHINPLPTQNT